MADNTTIGTGVSPGTTTIASDEIGGVQYQRVKVVHGADGTATDASSAAPLPTTDAAVATAVATVRTAVETLDLQMGAAPAQTGDVQGVRDRLPTALVAGGLAVTPTGTVTVDTELPAAALPTDGDANVSVPAVVARQQVRDGVTGNWYRAASARGDGQSLTPATVPANGIHSYDSVSSSSFPQRTARSVTDGESGTAFAPAGNMLWNGTTWERASAGGDVTVAIAAADRTGSVTAPVVNARGGVTRAVIVVSVTTAGTGYIELRVLPSMSGTILAGLRIADLTPGRSYGLMLGAGEQFGTPVGSGSTALTGVQYWVQRSPAPVPRGMQLQVLQDQAGGSTWNYSVSYVLLP